MTSTRRGPDPGVLWWLAGALLLVAAGVGGGHINGDGFLYIAHGRAMLEAGAILDVDPFSATGTKGPLILHHLGAMLGFSLVEQRWGLEPLIRMTGAASGVAIALFLWPARRSAVATILGALIIAVALWLDREQVFETRGQSWAYLALVAALALVARIKAGHARLFVLFLPLSAAWASTHPSFVFGIVLPLVVGCATLAETGARRPTAVPLFLAGAAALIGSLISPWGTGLLVDVVRLIGDPTTSRIEHMRSPVLEPGSVIFLVLAIGVAVWRRSSGPRSGRRSDVIVLVALISAWLISRRYSWFVVAWLVPMLRDAVTASGLDGRMRRWLGRPMATATIIVALPVALWLAGRPVDPWKNAPVAEVDAVEAAGIPGMIVSEFAWGGYLMYRWGTSRQVFVDGRNNLYNNGVFDDYLQLVFTGPQAAEVLDVYRAEAIVWPRGWKLDRWLAERPREWVEFHRGDRAVVYIRAGGVPRDPTEQRP